MADNRQEKYDVIIIGGGVAGLAAATVLRNQRVLIIEAEDHIGGRIETRIRNGVHYDVGAVFRWTDAALGDSLELGTDSIVKTSQNRGVITKEGVKFYKTHNELLNENFVTAETIKDPVRRCVRQYALLSSLFSIIHAGECLSYSEDLYSESFINWGCEYYKEGNKTLIERLLGLVDKCNIQCNSRVLSIKEENNVVAVEYENDKGEKVEIQSTKIIIATKAYEAFSLLDNINSPNLLSVRYAPFYVGVLAFNNQASRIEDFAYIVDPDRRLGSIFQQKKGSITLLSFFIAGQSPYIQEISECSLKEYFLENFNALGIGLIDEASIVFFDQKYWSSAETVIDTSFDQFPDDFYKISSRVFLAGDYTWLDYPLGIGSAYKSGIRAGKQVAYGLAL